MPFYGRPSKNCQSCRERRIKCDRIEPVCSQCKRVGKPCGGYRDVPSLLFRDENDKTARRSAAAKSKAETRRRLLDGLAEVTDTSPSPAKVPPRRSAAVPKRQPHVVLASTVPAPVSSTVEDRGLKFFFHQFVTAVPGPQGSSYNLNSTPLLNTLPAEAPLRNAAGLIGLGALANVTRDKYLLLVAREKYVTAINIVRSAVGNPAQANTHQIFKIIVLLSLYEMVCCAANQLDSWTVHIDGILALIRQATYNLALIHLDVRTQLQHYLILMLRYFMAPGAIPEHLLQWSPELIPSSAPEMLPAIRLVDVMVRFMKLHSSVHYNPDLDPDKVIGPAMYIDDEMEEWVTTLPEKWSFIVKESRDLQYTFNGKYLTYNDQWASRDLNHYHYSRLLLNEMILVHLARVKYPTPWHLKQRQRVLDTISRMATGICAGAASQMGLFGYEDTAKERQNLPPLNGVFMLLFPLSVAGSAAGAPAEVQAWVIKTLQRVGDTMGVHRALQLIPKVQQDREMNLRRLDRLHEVNVQVNLPSR